MFRKKKETAEASVLSEKYVPASLPKYGQSLDTFITGDYRFLSEPYITERYDACAKAMEPLIGTSDRFTAGNVCDAYLEGQFAHMEAVHLEDVAAHDLQVAHIRSALKVRREILERRITELEAEQDALRREIEPLQGLRVQFEMKLGSLHIPLALPVTILAMIVDACLNYSYLNGILLQNVFLLGITVACLSVMSDGSMYVLGSLISRRKERFMSKWLFGLTAGGLAAMFLLSVAAGVMIRFGSMDVTYGTINAAGEFVGRDSYSLAEWGISLVTAFLTTATGLISLAFSVDENAHLVARRRELEERLEAAGAAYSALVAERDAIDQAADPGIRDRQCRTAAEINLNALRTALKQHVRKLLAVHQGEATYTDAMAESARDLLPAPAQKAPQAGRGAEDLTLRVSEHLEEAC